MNMYRTDRCSKKTHCGDGPVSTVPEDSLPSCKTCTRPNRSSKGLQIFTSQNVVGLSARDGGLIGAAKANSLSGGVWEEA